MANVGQAALTLAGFYVGGMVGMPGLGAALGSMVGQALFPTKLPTVEGPQIADQAVTTSAIGAAWPWVFGRDAVAGNVLWTAPLVNHRNVEEAGGKGGPTQKTVYYTATRSYAVGLCRCPNAPIKGLLRAWRMDKLVYDIRPQLPDETDDAYAERVAASEGFAEGFTLYLGTADQMPDPTIEAVKGVGNTPAYRGRAYIVFTDEDVTDTGGRMPNWRFEIVTEGDDADSTFVQYSPAVLSPWSGGSDPRWCFNDHEYRLWGTSEEQAVGTAWTNSLQSIIDSLEDFDIDADRASNLLGWSRDRRRLNLAFEIEPGEREILYLHYNRHVPDEEEGEDYLATIPSGGVAACTGFQNLGIPVDRRVWWSGLNASENQVLTCTAGIYRVHPVDSAESQESSYNNCTNYPGTPQMLAVTDVIIQVRRKQQMPSPPCEPRCQDAYPLLPENADYCAIDGRVEHRVAYSVASGSFKALSNYLVSDGNVTDYPLGPLIPAGSADDNQSYWETQYAAALVAEKTIRPGLIYGVDYPIVPTTAYVRSYVRHALQAIPPTVGSIVRDICEEVEIPSDRIDVSDLTDTVPGYGLSTLMTARQAIQPLQAFQFFDCVESDALLKFPKRGKPIVATLSADELGARFAGETAPPLVATQIQQAVELPRFVRVHYKMGAKDYQAGMQQSPPRMTTDSVNAKDVQLAINMDDTKAAQIAQVIHQDDWWGRETYEVAVTPALLAVECADAVGIPVEGQIERARIVGVNMAPPLSPLKWSLRRDDDGAYVSYSVGASAPPSDDALRVAGPSEMLIIDGPALNAAANDAGVYVAVWSQFSRWTGAQVMRSIDEGGSYKDAVTVLTPATVGRVVGVMSAGPDANVWDFETVLVVDLDTGSLESHTADEVLNGANPAFIGADGRWEACQFASATLVGVVGGKHRYELRDWLRGRRGTEWVQGLHQAGDRFVLVGQGVARVPGVASDIGRTLNWKAVTMDTQPQAIQPQAHTMQGVALKPYSPCDLSAQRDADNNLYLTCVRRTRLSGEWLDLVDVPLNEATEAYQVDILDAGGSVLRTLSTSEPRVMYPLDLEVADFGNMTPTLRVRWYQMSATVGRGYPAEAVLLTPQSDTQPLPATVEISFTGTFDVEQQFFVNAYYGASHYYYVLDGSTKASLDDFAEELAGLIQADIPQATVNLAGSTITVSAPLLFEAIIGNNVLQSVAVEIKQIARPIFVGTDAQTGDFDLYYRPGTQLVRAPDDDARYQNSGYGQVEYSLYAPTYAAEKALAAAIAASPVKPTPLTYYAPPRQSGTFSGSRKGYALSGLREALLGNAVLQSLGLTVTNYPGLALGAIGVQSIGPYYWLDISIESSASTHPSGFKPGLSVSSRPTQETISYPAGAKQLTRVDFVGVLQLIEGAEFTVTLDGVDYTYPVASGDVGTDFTPVYDGLKALIEASGLFAVSFYLQNTYLEIERTAIDTPFTASARADVLAQATVTRI